MDVVKVGFTGTQKGMTPAQMSGVLYFLGRYESFILGHGLCIGADVEADDLTRSLPACKGIVGFPAKGVGAKAVPMEPELFLEWRTPRGPLLRNMDIAIWCDVMLATPKEEHMTIRSGTWTTCRYALQEEKPLFVVLPSGLVVPWAPVEW